MFLMSLKAKMRDYKKLIFYLEFSDHFFLFFGKLGSAHDVNINGVELVFEFTEEIIFGVFEDNLRCVKAFEASTVS